RCRCRTASAVASPKTRSQSAVPSSSLRDVSSSGFEQYTQCSGQRCVISAIRASGVAIINHSIVILSEAKDLLFPHHEDSGSFASLRMTTLFLILVLIIDDALAVQLLQKYLDLGADLALRCQHELRF